MLLMTLLMFTVCSDGTGEGGSMHTNEREWPLRLKEAGAGPVTYVIWGGGGQS